MAGATELFRYVLRLADDQLILGQRLGEWCGHAPTLEEDLALANIGLDLIGQSRALYDYAGALEGAGRDEDQLAFLRQEREYQNCLLVEQPNRDFAHTILRQLLYAAFMQPFWREIQASKDETLAGVAGMAVKEVTYHLRHAAQWTLRLGDGTSESHERMVEAIDSLWMYSGELFEVDDVTETLIAQGIAVDPRSLREEWEKTLSETLSAATLELPAKVWMQTGGRDGRHTEHMGHLLAELQYMQRAYPNMQW